MKKLIILLTCEILAQRSTPGAAGAVEMYSSLVGDELCGRRFEYSRGNILSTKHLGRHRCTKILDPFFGPYLIFWTGKFEMNFFGL